MTRRRIVKSKRDVASLRRLKNDLLALADGAATQIAKDVAPKISAMAHADYLAGRNAYSDARRLGKHGRVTLFKTGALFRSFGFEAEGPRVKAVLGTPYAKYMIGRFRILPIGDRSEIPIRWIRFIDGVMRAVLGDRWRRAKGRAAA